MQNSAPAPAASPGSLLAKASQIDFDRNALHPGELDVENLRRRGVDVLKIGFGGGAKTKRTFLQRLGFGGLGKSAAQPGRIAFIDKQIRVYDPAQPRAVQKETVINFADVKSVEFVAVSGRKKSYIRISAKDRAITLGTGLQDESLKWLRDRIVLEAAGLVWKPLFNVGKRTTRATINPDEEVYRQWQAGPNRLVSLFLEHAPGHMRSLEQAMSARDFATVRQNAHWLKSSSAAVGGALLSELFQRLEIEIDIKSTSDVEALVSHISVEFQKVSDTLNRLTGEGGVSGSAAAQSDGAGRPGPAADGPLAGVKVLLVEDSIVNQEVALDCLHETGCEVVLANDGHEAVARYSEQAFDIVLMDCQMSGMDGFRATRLIRDHEFRTGRQATPVIALTAHALKGDRDACLAAGMSDYMSKPFIPEVLIGKITEWLVIGLMADEAPASGEGAIDSDSPISSDVDFAGSEGEQAPDESGAVPDESASKSAA